MIAFRAEFIVTLNNTLILLYATKIYARKIDEKDRELRMQKLNRFKTLYQQLVKEEIESYNESEAFKTSLKFTKMYHLMNNYYNKIKEETKIMEINEATPKDNKTDAAFEILRPESPYKFSDLTSKDFNPKNRKKSSNSNLALTRSARSINKYELINAILFKKPIFERKRNFKNIDLNFDKERFLQTIRLKKNQKKDQNLCQTEDKSTLSFSHNKRTSTPYENSKNHKLYNERDKLSTPIPIKKVG